MTTNVQNEISKAKPNKRRPKVAGLQRLHCATEACSLAAPNTAAMGVINAINMANLMKIEGPLFAGSVIVFALDAAGNAISSPLLNRALA